METSYLLRSLILLLTVHGTNSIKNGRLAAQGQFPHAVMILHNELFACTGSIIGKSHILTVGHCMDTGVLSEFSVVAGQINPETFLNDGMRLQQIIWHPYYRLTDPVVMSHGVVENDIAVIKLEQNLQWTPHIQPMLLVDKREPCTCCLCALAGWGFDETEPHRMLSSYLTWTPIVLADSRASHSISSFLSPFEKCAYDPHSTATIAKGDSGAAIICNGRGVGIVHTKMTAGQIIYFEIFPYISFIYDAVMQ